MSWFLPFAGLEKKICRYLLQRYLGRFLCEKLKLEQLNVDLRKGKGTVKDVALNCEAINELCENQGWGIELTGGHVGEVTITVPWNAPMTDDSYIEVSNLRVILTPLPRQNDGSSMLESMWSSMSSSMQLAQECLEKEEVEYDMNTQNAAIEGLETFAQTIDSVLNRIKAKFLNTEIRLQYMLPSNQNCGIAIIIKIDNLSYQNEAGNDAHESVIESDTENSNERKTHLLSTYATHNIKMDGISFYTEEFRINTSNGQDDIANNTSNIFESSQFYSVLSNFSENQTHNPHIFSTCDSKSLEHESIESIIENPKEMGYHSSNPIKIAQLEGNQVIRIQMKQSEALNGPKVSLELQLGSLFIFLSPRQTHLILHFYDIFLNEQQIQNKVDVPPEENITFTSLRKNIGSNMIGATGNLGGWSCEPGDEFPSTSTKLLQKNINPILHIDKSTKFEYCESINSSMTTSSSTNCSSKFQRKIVNRELNGEISQFNIRCASLTAVLLHEEILLEDSSESGSPVNDDGVRRLINLSNAFFSCINSSLATITNYECNKNHLKLFLKPIIIEGEQQRCNNFITLKLTASITRTDFVEVSDNIENPLIEFDRSEVCSDGFHKRPEVTILVKTYTPTSSSAMKKPSKAKTEINFNLESCIAELDISLYDRLSAILCASPYSLSKTSNNDNEAIQQFDKYSEPTIELNLQSAKINLRLRFPIVDSRPSHDPNKFPWWKQNIRPDFISFNFIQFRLKNCLTLIEISANEIDVFYCESVDSPPIQICKTSSKDNSGITSQGPYIEYPKISIEFPTGKQLQSILKCNAEDSDSGETSGESFALYQGRNREPLPFSSKRVCRQSDTPHLKDDIDESETILLPGDAPEMKKFCEKAMKTSKLQFKIFLPVASVQIKSKLLYEIIYNRFNSDLLMWEPNAPNLTKKTTSEKFVPSKKKSVQDDMLWSSGMMDSIYIPSMTSNTFVNNQNEQSFEEKSTSSDGPDTECESDSIYYSTYEKKRTKRLQPKNLLMSTCSFELIVNEAIVSLYSPVRDSENRVIPEQSGEYVVEVEKLNLFSVSGYNGNNNLSYLCIQSKLAKLHHCGLIPNADKDQIFRLIHSTLPNYILPTFFPTPSNFTYNISKGFENRDMVSFAIEIKKVPEQRIKRIRLTTGIHNTTLRHNPAISQHTWINQIIDLFDVVDYPIEGYEPYDVLTEMQLHLWDCSVDYRPLNFPFRAVIEVGNFMLSSNLISSVSGCTLRFISEDCTLSLAPYCSTGRKASDSIDTSFISAKNLVPVLDLGLLDISLRLNEKTNEIFPNLDLRASIQDMHIRTCSDSGRALALLISYIASDGDLINTENDNNKYNLMAMESSTNLLLVDDSKNSQPQISAKQQEYVNSLMAEVIQETESSCRQSSESDDENTFDKNGIELFCFPDESKQKQRQQFFDIEKSSKSKIKDDGSSESLITLVENNSTVTRSSSEEWTPKPRRESESSNEMRDLLDFEHNVMNMVEEEAVEALPQIREELGEVPCKVSNKDKNNKSRKNSFNLEDDFYVIADEEKALIARCGINDIKITPDPLRIVDNHFTSPIGKPDLLKAPEGFPTPTDRYTLCEMTVTWHLYGGYDFPKNEKLDESKPNKENILPRRKTEMSDAYRLSVSYSKGHQSVQFGKKEKNTEINKKNRGGPGRIHDILVEMHLSKVRFSHETYPIHATQASRQVIVISEMEIRDRLETSEIKKFLYHPKTKNLPNTSSQHMVVIKALHIRPNLHSTQTQECSLRISLLPLRLNIDQNTLLFMVTFFNDLGRSLNDVENDDVNNLKKNSVSQLQEPIMMVDDLPESINDLRARKMVSTNLELLMEEDQSTKRTNFKELDSDSKSKPKCTESDLPIYFKEIVFSPEVLIRLDYHGRRVEMSRGPLAGLLMGLGQLQCSEIRLRKIIHRHGILGFDKLLNFLFKEWLQDIKKNQLPTILSGVGPMYTLVQLFQGIRDLFWLPIEQYQKDGRIIRGLQLGAQSFTARTALAALEITSRIIQLLQITAETAFDMVSPGPSLRRIRQNRGGKRKRPHRPQDIREGVANAYQIVKDGLNDTATALIENAIVEHDQKGYSGAVGAVFRQIPPLVVCPVVLATQATTNVLGGVKNQLVPDARFEAREKWKGDND